MELARLSESVGDSMHPVVRAILQSGAALFNGKAYFDGNGDYLTVASNDFIIGSEDYTIDFRFKHNNPSDTIGSSFVAMGNATNYWQVIIRNGAVRFNICVSGDFSDPLNVSKQLDTEFHHFAWVKSGSTNTIYYDGVSLDSWTRSDYSYITTNTLYIGANYNGGKTAVNGYIDEFRVSKGVARWTSNFTPPTEPYAVDANTKLLLHLDSSPITDETGKTVATNGNVVIVE